MNSHHAAFLQDYIPFDASESETKDQALLLLGQYPHSFCRTHLPGHFTASALIVNAEKSHILLMHHKKLNLWLQPGGHWEDGETLELTARREAFEEVGISQLELMLSKPFDIDQHSVPAIGSESAHVHFDVRYLFVCQSQEALTPNEESLGLRWVPILDLPGVNGYQEDSWNRLSKKLISWLAENPEID